MLSKELLESSKSNKKYLDNLKTGQHAFCVIHSVIDALIKRNLEVIYHLNQIVSLPPE